MSTASAVSSGDATRMDGTPPDDPKRLETSSPPPNSPYKPQETPVVATSGSQTDILDFSTVEVDFTDFDEFLDTLSPDQPHMDFCMSITTTSPILAGSLLRDHSRREAFTAALKSFLPGIDTNPIKTPTRTSVRARANKKLEGKSRKEKNGNQYVTTGAKATLELISKLKPEDSSPSFSIRFFGIQLPSNIWEKRTNPARTITYSDNSSRLELAPVSSTLESPYLGMKLDDFISTKYPGTSMEVRCLALTVSAQLRRYGCTPFRIIACGKEREDGSRPNLLSYHGPDANMRFNEGIRDFRSYFNGDVEWNGAMFVHFLPGTNLKSIHTGEDRSRMALGTKKKVTARIQKVWKEEPTTTHQPLPSTPSKPASPSATPTSPLAVEELERTLPTPPNPSTITTMAAMSEAAKKEDLNAYQAIIDLGAWIKRGAEHLRDPPKTEEQDGAASGPLANVAVFKMHLDDYRVSIGKGFYTHNSKQLVSSEKYKNTKLSRLINHILKTLVRVNKTDKRLAELYATLLHQTLRELVPLQDV